MKLVNTDGFKAISFAAELCEIARPLKRFGIHYFNHIRVFDDGSRLSFGTNGLWLQHFFDNSYYKIGNFSSKPLVSNYLLWKFLPSDGVLEIASKEFNIDNGITIIEKNKTYTDLYLFASTRNNDAINNFYINNLDVLKHFINYYKEKSSLFIDSCIPDKPILSKQQQIESKQPLQESIILSSYIHEFYNETKINKFKYSYAAREVVLSANQHNIITLLLKGYNTKEIARILKLSPKTCQIYIDKIKLKFNCSTRNELLTLFRSEKLNN